MSPSVRTFLSGDKVRWCGKDGLPRSGVVTEVRRPTKLGRIWVQVRVTPNERSSYAGHKSIRASKLELVK